jgi:outer membrane protein assembly factor BamB
MNFWGRAAILALGALVFGACGSLWRGAEREGFVAPIAVFDVRWRRHLTEEPLLEYKPQEFAAATSDGRRVFVGSSQGEFYALAPRDGSILWKSKTGPIGGEPTVVDELGLVFVGAEDGNLYALDAATGRQRWAYATKGPIDSHPAYADGMLFFTTGENRVYGLDALRGTWKWQYDRESPESFTIRGYASPFVLGDRVYVGFSDGYLATLKAQTGDVIWNRSLAGDATRFVDVDSTPFFYGGTLFVSSYAGGVYGIDPKEGSVKWHYDIEGAGSVRVAEDRIYFTAAKGGLHCLDLSGRLLFRQSIGGGGELSSPLVIRSYVLTTSAKGGLYVADAVTGRLYQYLAPGHGITGAATADQNQVYFLSNGGYLYALALKPSVSR